jgi:hypothetical protein
VSLPDYLSCLDVYVCPSVRETYGISVVQAMAMSLPVIHFGYGGMQVGWMFAYEYPHAAMLLRDHPVCVAL